MPNFDKTGPNGQGEKTGNQQGNCDGATPQSNSTRPQRGFGFRRCGFGFGRRFDKEQYRQFLEEELKNLA